MCYPLGSGMLFLFSGVLGFSGVMRAYMIYAIGVFPVKGFVDVLGRELAYLGVEHINLSDRVRCPLLHASLNHCIRILLMIYRGHSICYDFLLSLLSSFDTLFDIWFL